MPSRTNQAEKRPPSPPSGTGVAAGAEGRSWGKRVPGMPLSRSVIEPLFCPVIFYASNLLLMTYLYWPLAHEGVCVSPELRLPGMAPHSPMTARGTRLRALARALKGWPAATGGTFVGNSTRSGHIARHRGPAGSAHTRVQANRPRVRMNTSKTEGMGKRC
jgi:hypothetical protein